MPAGTIVLFGYHDRESPRFWSIRQDLHEKGYEIAECHTAEKGLLAKYRDLKKQWNEVKDKADALFVMFPGQYLLPLAWKLTRRPRKKLVFDAFVSVYDSIVLDRQLISRWNPRAWFLYLVDVISCRLADDITTDTRADADFFIKKFHIDATKVRVSYLGARTDLFTPRKKKKKINGPLQVLFYGTYIPLQGVDVILRAAAVLQERQKNVQFTLIGAGQLGGEMRQLAQDLNLKNVTFVPFLPLPELPVRMADADVCLGIFSTSDKAARVIPHKVYDAVAMNIPVITRDSPAIRELFENHPGVILCDAGNPTALAGAIETRMGTSELGIRTSASSRSPSIDSRSPTGELSSTSAHGTPAI